MKKIKTLKEVLAQYVESTTSSYKGTPCWNWTGGRTRDGYGQTHLNGDNRLTHRLSFQTHFGPLKTGQQVSHMCHNRLCMNPDHLTQMTPKDNKLQSTIDNRPRKPSVRLSTATKQYIYDNEQHIRSDKLMEKYDISAHTTTNIKNGNFKGAKL